MWVIFFPFLECYLIFIFLNVVSQRVHLKLNRRHYTLVLHENSSNNAYFIVTKQSCITHIHTQNFNSSDKLIFCFFFPSLPVLCWIVALNIYIMIMVNKIQRVCWRRLGYDMAKIERKSFFVWMRLCTLHAGVEERESIRKKSTTFTLT